MLLSHNFQSLQIMNTIKASTALYTGDEYATTLHNDLNENDTPNSISFQKDEGLCKTTDSAKITTHSGQSKTPPEDASPTSTIVSLEDRIGSYEKVTFSNYK